MARNWNALSTAYRNRLSRAGITQSSYEAGASLSAARGHAHTPERPTDAKKNPKRYSRYLTSQKQLRQQVIDRKESFFGSRPRFNDAHSRQYVMLGVEHPTHFEQRPPSIAEMKAVLKMTDAEMDARVSAAARRRALEDEVYTFLFYH